MTDADISQKDPSAKQPKQLLKKHLLISGTQSCDGETIKNELNTTAKYLVRGEKHYIFYDEYQEDGTSLQCRLLITPKEAELKKSGQGVSILRFLPGTRQECHYQSPVGTLSLVSDTQRLHLTTTETGMHLNLHYTLYMNASPLSEYELNVNVF